MKKRTRTAAEERELARLIADQAQDDRRSRIDVTAGMEAILGESPGLSASQRARGKRRRVEDWIYEEAREIAGENRGATGDDS